MICLSRSQWLAFLSVACSSTTAWGQLPANKLSPINQINRAWGFWVSDGYHECPDPEKQRNLISRNKSVLDKFDPIGASLYKHSSVVVPHTQALVQPAVPAMPMVTLPSQPYSQFATPAETPLPGSNYAPQTPPPLPPPATPYSSSPHPITPNFPSDDRSYVPSPFPDPRASEPMPSVPPAKPAPRSTPQSYPSEPPQKSSELNLLDGSEPSEEVPPSPPLRRRQPSDKPLGETPDSWKPPEKKQPQPQLVPESDEDLNLLSPSGNSPPVTYDYGRSNGNLVGWRNDESYPPNFPQANQQYLPPGYQQQLPIDQSYRQPGRATIPTRSRSLIQREYPQANMPYMGVQVQSVPTYTTVQNPYAQYNSNRYR